MSRRGAGVAKGYPSDREARALQLMETPALGRVVMEVARGLIRQGSRAIWRTVVDNQDAEAGRLEQALQQGREVVAFVVGGNDDQCLKPGVRPHDPGHNQRPDASSIASLARRSAMSRIFCLTRALRACHPAPPRRSS